MNTERSIAISRAWLKSEDGDVRHVPRGQDAEGEWEGWLVWVNGYAITHTLSEIEAIEIGRALVWEM